MFNIGLDKKALQSYKIKLIFRKENSKVNWRILLLFDS